MFLQMIPNEFAKIVDLYNRLCESIHKKMLTNLGKKKKRIFILD